MTRARSARVTGVPVLVRHLHAPAAIVSQDRPDLSAGEGLLPPSLLADLMGHSHYLPPGSE